MFSSYACLCTPMCLVCAEARRGHQIQGDKGYRWPGATVWVLGIKLRFFEREIYALTAEPSLQGFMLGPQVSFVLILAYFARCGWKFSFLHLTSLGFWHFCFKQVIFFIESTSCSSVKIVFWASMHRTLKFFPVVLWSTWFLTILRFP